MRFLLMTICVLGLAATLTRGDNPCPCQTTTTPAPDCGCNCGGNDGDGSDGSWNQGVTHYWDFNNDMQDRVGSSNIQACVGDWHYDNDRNGNENGSITFDSAFCVLPDGVYFSGPFTIAMWFKIGDSNNGTITLLQFSTAIQGNRVELAVSSDDGAPKATLLLQAEVSIIGEVFGHTEINLDEWTHVAATFDGVTGSVYINGALDNQQNMSQPFYGAYRDSNSFGGCCDSETGGFAISASYDDVRIYGRDLTADEVSQLAAASNTNPPNEHDEVDESHNQCNESPMGFCMVNCSSAYPYFVHHGSMSECLHGQKCCTEMPESATETNGCTEAGGFCVQNDNCRVGDLFFAEGCDQSSVTPICCNTWHYYIPHSLVDYFLLDTRNVTECYGADLGCSSGGDCCSYNCMGAVCA